MSVHRHIPSSNRIQMSQTADDCIARSSSRNNWRWRRGGTTVYYAGLTRPMLEQPSDEDEDQAASHPDSASLRANLSRAHQLAQTFNLAQQQPAQAQQPDEDAGKSEESHITDGEPAAPPHPAFDWSILNASPDRTNTVGIRAHELPYEGQVPVDPPGKYYSHAARFERKGNSRIISRLFAVAAGVILGTFAFMYMPSQIEAALAGALHGTPLSSAPPKAAPPHTPLHPCPPCESPCIHNCCSCLRSSSHCHTRGSHTHAHTVPHSSTVNTCSHRPPSEHGTCTFSGPTGMCWRLDICHKLRMVRPAFTRIGHTAHNPAWLRCRLHSERQDSHWSHLRPGQRIGRIACRTEAHLSAPSVSCCRDTPRSGSRNLPPFRHPRLTSEASCLEGYRSSIGCPTSTLLWLNSYT